MKKLKQKILAFFCCICMMLVSLSGCSLLVKDNSKALASEAIRVGSTVLTKQEVVNLWYSFYTENVNYFYYYDEDQILEIFYKNVIVKYAVLNEADKLKADGKIFYTNADDATVWLQVFDSIASSVDTYETALLEQNGVDEDNLPSRLSSSSSTAGSTNTDITSYLFSDYHFDEMSDYTYSITYSGSNTTKVNASDVGSAVKNTTISKMIELMEKYVLTKQAVELDDDEDVIDADADLDVATTVIANVLDNTAYYKAIEDADYRQQAYNMYIGNLLISAKAEGKTTTKQATIFEEIKRLYNSYYETYIYNTYSTYIKSLINNPNASTVSGGYGIYALSDANIVSRYLQLLGRDIQDYSVEQNYIAVVEAEADNTLLLYHFNGENYYFSVQHLLVSFDDDITDTLATLFGADGSSDIRFDDLYRAIRNEYYKNISDGANGYLTSWNGYNNVIYRDENGYQVYQIKVNDITYKVYFDADKVIKSTDDDGNDIDDDDKLNGYYYDGYILDADKEETVDGYVLVELDGEEEPKTIRKYLTASEFADCTSATIKVETMLGRFNDTYSRIIAVLDDASGTTASAIKETLDGMVDSTPDVALSEGKIAYSISEDIIEDYLSADDKTELKNKIFSNLFMQHAYVYSADSASLGTDLSDYVGMIISSGADNNTVGGSTYVADFTNGARKLVEQIINNGNDKSALQSTLSKDNFVISDYGIHIIVVNDIYKDTTSVTGDELTYNKIFGNGQSEEEIATNVANAIEKLKTTYISTASGQTLYEYLYEKMRDELVGSSGTLFTAVRNAIYADYTNNKAMFEYYEKPSYNELLELIGVNS